MQPGISTQSKELVRVRILLQPAGQHALASVENTAGVVIAGTNLYGIFTRRFGG